MGNLIARHDITEEKLRDLLELGGFPKPSIAITTDTNNLEGFGAYTFLFKKDSIDPAKDSRNLLYEADAYTARFPEIKYDWDQRKLNKAFKEQYGVPLEGNVFHMQENIFWDFHDAVSLFLQYVKPKEVPMTRDEAEEFLKKNAKVKAIAREDVDYYTRSGNRKSFKAITRPYTLENIMNEMDSNQGAEQGQHGMTTWKGSLARTIRKLSDIDKDRIVESGIADPLYKQARDAFTNLCIDVDRRLGIGYPKVESMEIIEGIQTLDEKHIQRAFRDACVGLPKRPDGKGQTELDVRTYKANDSMKPVPPDLVDAIIRTGLMISELPVTYLEEKPDRAVGFGEVGAIVIPNNAPDDLFIKLSDTFSVPVIPYDPEKPETRLEAFAAAEKIVPELNLEYESPREKELRQAEQEKQAEKPKMTMFRARIRRWKRLVPPNYDSMPASERNAWETTFNADWSINKDRYFAEECARENGATIDVAASIKARHNASVGKDKEYKQKEREV